MARVDVRTIRFVRSLLPDLTAQLSKNGEFELNTASRVARLDAATVAVLVSLGVLAGDKHSCRPNAETLGWLRRQVASADEFGTQHRQLKAGADAATINLAESPLARLAAADRQGGAPFLAPHQVEAGERLRRLIERGQLRTRVTMSYDPARATQGRSAGTSPGDIGDFALDARRQLQTIAAALPAECFGVLVDVCGLLKGLQQVEIERGWPRRSAKLVLRIALDQLAGQFGLGLAASGPSAGVIDGWLPERPMRFE